MVVGLLYLKKNPRISLTALSAKKPDFVSTRIWTHPVVEFASCEHLVHPINHVLNFRRQNGYVNVVC